MRERQVTGGSDRRGVRLLIVVGAVLAVLGVLAGHANRQLFDGPTLADHIDEIRRDDAVATLVGQEISRQIVTANPDLAALRPLIDDVAIRVAGSDALSGPTRRAAAIVHDALVNGTSDAIELRLVDAGAVVSAVLGAVAPDRAPVSTDVSVTLAEIGGRDLSTGVVDLARAVDVLAWLLPIAALIALGGAVARSRSRWATAGAVGRALVVAAGILGLLLVIGGIILRRFDDDELTGAVARAAWTTVIRPLWWNVVILATVGVAVVLACDGASSAAVVDRAARVRTAVARRPRTSGGLVVRSIVALVVGVAAITDPLGLLGPLIVLAGVGLVVFAITEIAGFAVPSPATDPDPDGRRARRQGSRRTTYSVLGVAAAVMVATVVAQARPGGEVAVVEADGELTCNGHAELCDRAFDDVAYVASHNAMAVLEEPGWFLAEQTDPIPMQLDQGVRALLVDVWSGRSAGTVVRTAASSHAEALAVAEAELGPEVVAAALRIADSVAGSAVGPERRYLCHGLCETGSTPFVEMLEQLRAWLVANPTEVVTLFIEDHVEAGLIAEDIVAAGLLPLIATPPAVGEPWLTLGEMVDAGDQLVVMVEAGVGGTDAPWMVNGFEHTQETPFTFPTVADFSCAPNRGPADAALFLLNHWLAGFGAIVSNAELVNDREVLLTRARQCQDERGQIPNFIAVNYVDRGDVYDVVDELNGVAD